MTTDLKFGRRPPKDHPALRLSQFLTGIVPAHPDRVDYLSKLSNWDMLGNDQYGDCVAVTWANNRRLVTAALGNAEVYPTLDQVIKLYTTQNPNFPIDDNGMDEQTCLEYLASSGGPDGVMAVAFAKVDVTNQDELDAAIAIFGSIWTGFLVQHANMAQFDAVQPWDFVPGSPVDGGHATLGGGYGPNVSDDLRFITWAAETSCTEAFITNEFEEAWIVIWPEHLGTKAFQQGVDLTKLAEAYKALTSKDLPIPPQPAPVPVPAPVPDPVPPPAPDPVPVPPAPDPVPPAPDPVPPMPPVPPVETADQMLADAVHDWVLGHHRKAAREVAMAIRIWLEVKGLL